MLPIGRILKGAGRLIFMDPKFSEVAEKTLSKSFKANKFNGIHKQFKNAFLEGERAADVFERSNNSSFLGGLKRQITDLPKDLKSGWAAKGAWGKFKGVGGQLMKRLPLLFVAMEIPNIYSAFKDEGLIGGLTEILKSGTRMAGSMAGFIVGQALIPIPIVGGLIGAIGCDWLISKITGKSHSEKKAEAEEALANSAMSEQQAQELQQQLMQQQMMAQNPYGGNAFAQNPYASKINIPQMTMSQQQLMAMQQMLYNNGLNGNFMDQDFMSMVSGMNRLNYMC